jgi:uncharacterized protein (DUF697 family)
MAKLPVKPSFLFGLAKELRVVGGEERPLALAGARELVGALRKELTRNGVASAVVEGGRVQDACALVYVLAGELTEADEQKLREADEARVPIVCVVVGPAAAEEIHVPYVLATDLIRVRAGSGFPVDEIGRVLGRRLGERATSLAANLPALRAEICEALIRKFSLQNAVLGVVVFMPGADLPALTLNEVRLVLRIADAHGFQIDRERVPEVVAVVGGGLGLRALARELLDLVPVAGWLVKGGVAYGGTRAIGEAAVRYFEARTPITRIPSGDRSVR